MLENIYFKWKTNQLGLMLYFLEAMESTGQKDLDFVADLGHF